MTPKNISVSPVLYPRKDKNGLFPVKIRITENRVSKFENLNFSLSKSHWLKTSKRVSTSNPNHIEYNFIIETKLKEYEDVKNRFGKVKVGKLNLFEVLEIKIQSLKSRKYYSHKKYRTLYYHLEKFWGNLDLFIYNIDKEFFIEFKNYLQDNIVSRNLVDNTPSDNTIVNYLDCLKTILKEKQSEGFYLPDLGFTKNIIPTKVPTPKRTLTEEEMWKLDNILPSHPSFRPLLWNSLNTFLFNFWSQGLRIGDCLKLRWGNIQDGEIVLNMGKTRRDIVIPLNSSNIHRLKWYMEKYYPIWDWKEDKWNNYHNTDFDNEAYFEWLFSHESEYVEFLNMIESEKDKNYQDISLFHSPNFERVLLDRYGVKYHNIIKEKSPELFESLDERKEMVDRELTQCIKEYSKDDRYKNQFIFPFLRGYENEKDMVKMSNKISSSVALINKSLREIGKLTNIDKKFSNHWSRHTITSISRSLGVDLYELRNWLGHTSVKTTESYVNTITTHSSLKNSKNVKSLLENFNSKS